MFKFKVPTLKTIEMTVDLQTMPELPITHNDDIQEQLFAEALQNAIESKVITEPGKYKIAVHIPLWGQASYDIYLWIED